jgi:hypothetical protein
MVIAAISDRCKSCRGGGLLNQKEDAASNYRAFLNWFAEKSPRYDSESAGTILNGALFKSA